MSRIANRDWQIFAPLGLIAVVIAGLSARPYAGGWNDGSRLATVECLVDHGALSIDRSIFVEVPHEGLSPYPRDDQLLQQYGTKDKLFIDGRYYSDKSPVPAFYLAVVYKTARSVGMPPAAERPGLFCLLMTWASSGAAYAIAVLCLFSIARRIGLDRAWSTVITLLFAIGTVALPYAQHVNNHILLLAVAMLIFRLLLIGSADGWTSWRSVAAGCLVGVAYTIDLGAGPPLCLLVCALSRKRLWVVAAALPWIAFHHVVNYHIGGSLAPANANPAFFNWPGSPFNEQNMTGGWKHASLLKAVLYAFDMLFGKKGFLGHNLLLFVSIFGLSPLLRSRYPERSVVLLGLLWSAGTWLLYAATSNNQSGACCSVRWFVPLLAPGFVALCVLLRDRPERKIDVILLGAGSVLLGIGMAIRGPWFARLMPFYWIIYVGTVASWLTTRWFLARTVTTTPADLPLRVWRIGLPERAAVAEPASENTDHGNGSDGITSIASCSTSASS